MSNISIVWLRRDLRLGDNPALEHAIANSDQVLLTYIHAPHEEAPWQPGAASNWWLHHSLTALTKSLEQLNARFIIREGDSLNTLMELCIESGTHTIYWNRLYDPAIIERDNIIKQTLASQGIDCHSYNGALLREPWEVSKGDGTFYRVYTPFSKKYFQLSEIELPYDKPQSIPKTLKELPSLTISDLNLLPTIPWDKGFYKEWTPGELGAEKHLNHFINQGLFSYSEGRNIPATDGVSMLSPHLHFGEISPRQIWHTVQHHAALSRKETQTFPYIRQLIWRDFAHHLLYHLPHTSAEPFNKKFKSFQWEKHPELLFAWQQGKTGIPLVDAGMRQLWQTGWMHNRVRMLVASVLTKNGLIHWREGAHWFWNALVDANLANNTMGWQWVAGCGVDAAPYFRIFSPTRQGERFDADGEYIKKWVPELQDLSSKYIHEPWLAPQNILEQADIVLGETYPNPIVDLSMSRNEALARYKALS